MKSFKPEAGMVSATKMDRGPPTAVGANSRLRTVLVGFFSPVVAKAPSQTNATEEMRAIAASAKNDRLRLDQAAISVP